MRRFWIALVFISLVSTVLAIPFAHGQTNICHYQGREMGSALIYWKVAIL